MSKIVAWKIPPSEGLNISRLRKQTILFSLPLYKIMTYIALSFEFVNILFTNKSVAHLYNNIPHAPGGYNPELEKE